MLLLVGLGNPGPRHAANRHNIGFMAADALARAHKAPAWRRRFQGEVTEGLIGPARALILKPQTYMNESGRAVAEAARFHKIALGDIVVFHDELDLAPAKVRVKTGGGDAGHNGLRSITSHLGAGYRRVRLGIGHPGDKAMVHAYVLNDFGRDERPWVEDVCTAIADFAEPLVASDDAGFQNQVHLRLEAQARTDVKRVMDSREKG